eukprot:1158362-Pelagomonas_calceolata.AAC.3
MVCPYMRQLSKYGVVAEHTSAPTQIAARSAFPRCKWTPHAPHRSDAWWPGTAPGYTPVHATAKKG